MFTEVRGRPAIFWQTQRTARTSNPGGRVPRSRVLRKAMTIIIDTRERYAFRFSARADVVTEREPLPAGDYGVRFGDRFLAVVERKGIGRYPALLDLAPGRAGFLADVLARLQLRYPEVQLMFADNRKFAEEWTHRYLAAAATDVLES